MLTLAYVPCASEKEARNISKILAEEKLVACANIVKSESMFNWEGELENSDEWIILAKTLPSKFKEVSTRVLELHSYDVPCILGIPIKEVNEEYLNWVKEQLWINHNL